MTGKCWPCAEAGVATQAIANAYWVDGDGHQSKDIRRVCQSCIDAGNFDGPGYRPVSDCAPRVGSVLWLLHQLQELGDADDEGRLVELLSQSSMASLVAVADAIKAASQRIRASREGGAS